MAEYLFSCLLSQVLLVLCTTITRPVNGAYTVQMRMGTYSNPANIDFQHICCDPHTLCISPCDVYFTFCYRAINTAVTSAACWQQQSTMSNPIETGSITAPQTGPLYHNSPVSNPITFTATTGYPGMFQMMVRIEDHDFDPDDLIDIVLFNKVITPGSGWTNSQTLSGNYNAASVSARFRVFCNQNYYGSNCLTFCVATNNNQGHYTCNSNGQKVCLSGWTNVGSAENCLTPICASGCSSVGGRCNSPGECICNNGWTGTNCDQCIRKSGCVHGTCNMPGECNCNTGYGGPNCDQDLDVCGHQQPCLNGASCTNAGPNKYNCTCIPGHNGTNCETDINECSPPPCMNGGTCMDLLNAFSCLCAPGWTGDTCNENIDDCDPNPCQNGGNCTDQVNGYSCQCAPGWTGNTCNTNIDECDPNPCQNGNCTDQVNGFSCQCALGWTGMTCAENINDCDPNPCQNRGNCTDRLAAYECDCATGFLGQNCEDHICDSSPCANMATCTGVVGGFRCTCPPGVTGSDCGMEINECDSMPCQNGGSCQDLRGDYGCRCVTDFVGKNCEFRERVPQCRTNPCPRGLTCAAGNRTEFVCIQCSPEDRQCVVLTDSDALAANSTTRVSVNVWAAVGGAVGGALLLGILCLIVLVAIICCGKRNKTKSAEIQSLDGDPFKSVVTDNPAYLSVSTLVSPASTLQHPGHYDNPNYSRDIPNPLYATNLPTSPTPPAPYSGRWNGSVNPYASISSEEELKGNARNSTLNAKTGTGQYDNLYTFDPTEDDTESDAGSKLDPDQEAPYVKMKQSSPFSREASTVENPYEFSPKEEAPVENPYDFIPGEQSPTTDGIYEKLPPEIN